MEVKFAIQTSLYLLGIICLIVDVFSENLGDLKLPLFIFGLALLFIAYVMGVVDDHKSTQAEEERDSKIDGIKDASFATQRTLEEYLAIFKTTHQGDLQDKYPLGYGIIYTDGDRTLRENAFRKDVNIDWNNFRVLRRDGAAFVNLPTITSQLIGVSFENCKIEFDLANLTPSTILHANGIEIVAEVVMDVSTNIAAIVGITPTI